MCDEEWTGADDAVEEVREARRQVWERCDNDPRQYMTYMRAFHALLVNAGWPEAPPPPPGNGLLAGSVQDHRTIDEVRADEEDAAEGVKGVRRAEWERLINQPGKLLALLQDLEDQLVREGFIKPGVRSPGQGKSAA